MAEKKLKFEAALRELEAVVAELEAGNVPLDESLALYEKGMKLVGTCNKALEEAEQRIEVVKLTCGGVSTEPFSKELTDEH